MRVVVPVKRLERSKERLKDALSPEARRELVLRMLREVLSALKASDSVEGVLVIGHDVEVARIAELYGASFTLERSEGLNAAVEQAASELGEDDAMLVVPADVPLLDPSDIDSIALHHPAARPALSLVPDRHKDRTAALLASPPRAIGFRFGPDSFLEHKRAAERGGVALSLLELHNLALDVDTEEDLALVRHEQERQIQGAVPR
jgi:2-phospho-L-lactate guanylyltransferase